MGCYLFRDRQSGGITYFSCFVVSWGGRHHGSIAMHVFTGCCLFRGSASRRHHLSCCHVVGISVASIFCVMSAAPVMSSLASRRHHLSCCHGVGISAASIFCVMAAAPVMSSLTAPCAASPVMMCQRCSSSLSLPFVFSPVV